MAKPRRQSGHSKIANAKKRYEHSLKNIGALDYHAIAIAIGDTPIAPPDWAIKACQHHAPNYKASFEASRARGEPDYKFVIFALGASNELPDWAIEACIEATEAVEKQSASDEPDEGALLDVVVHVLSDHDLATRSQTPMSLRAAIKEALRREDCSDLDDPTNRRRLERAWLREQEEDEIDSWYYLNGYKITSRIERVLLSIGAQNEGLPPNPVRGLWRAENSTDSE